MGAEVIWPIAKAIALVAVIVGIVAMTFRQVRKRGKAEGELGLILEQEERNDEADEIMAEPIGDPVSWAARLRAKFNLKT